MELHNLGITINNKQIKFSLDSIIEENEDQAVIELNNNYVFIVDKKDIERQDNCFMLKIKTYHPNYVMDDKIETHFDYINVNTKEKYKDKWTFALRNKKHRRYYNNYNKALGYLDDDEYDQHFMQSHDKFNIKKERKKQNRISEYPVHIIT